MFAVVHQDEHLIVLNKPSGLLAVPGRGADLQDCLSARVQACWSTALVVHRLDRDTSGLMVMALSPAAQRALNRQFAERAVEKDYMAMVFGSPADQEGLIDLPIRKDFENPPRQQVDLIAGRPSQTLWRALDRLSDRTRLEVMPVTGRSHQIRLHLATLGHPILGDNLYAHPCAWGMATRLMLHARRLSLTHPESARPMSWVAECPF